MTTHIMRGFNRLGIGAAVLVAIGGIGVAVMVRPIHTTTSQLKHSFTIRQARKRQRTSSPDSTIHHAGFVVEHPFSMMAVGAVTEDLGRLSRHHRRAGFFASLGWVVAGFV
jgi:hypothetical protein